MKHFMFTFILIILGLGHEYTHAQDDSSPAQSSTPPVAEKDERPTEKSNHKKEQAVEPDNEISVETLNVERPEISVLSRSDKLTEQANGYAFWQTIFSFFTLLFAGFATWFAWGAWQAGKLAVRVTREMGVAQARSYVDVLDVHGFGKPRTSLDKQIASKSKPAAMSGKTKLIFEFGVRNSGSIPAQDVVISYTINACFSGNKAIKSKAQGIKFGYIGPRSENYKLSAYDCEITPKKKETDELVIDMTIVIHSSDGLIKADPKSKPVILTQKFFGIYRMNRPLTASGGEYLTEGNLDEQIAKKKKAQKP